MFQALTRASQCIKLTKIFNQISDYPHKTINMNNLVRKLLGSWSLLESVTSPSTASHIIKDFWCYFKTNNCYENRAVRDERKTCDKRAYNYCSSADMTQKLIQGHIFAPTLRLRCWIFQGSFKANASWYRMLPNSCCLISVLLVGWWLWEFSSTSINKKFSISITKA